MKNIFYNNNKLEYFGYNLKKKIINLSFVVI